MENWEIDFYWLKVRHFIKDSFGTSALPDLETMLFLIGVQELGHMETSFNKEEKMQLIHNATAHLFSDEGYFELKGRDEKNWPIWENNKALPYDDKQREEKLKELIIGYFDDLMEEEE